MLAISLPVVSQSQLVTLREVALVGCGNVTSGVVTTPAEVALSLRALVLPLLPRFALVSPNPLGTAAEEASEPLPQRSLPPEAGRWTWIIGRACGR
jgi:hypothetical protein